MVLLTDLPPEIVQHVLGYVDPPDLGRVPLVCKNLYHTVKGNSAIFRSVYLNILDRPADQFNVNWEQIVKDTAHLQAIGRRDRGQDKENELPFVYDTVKALLRNASVATDTERSRNAELLDGIFSEEANQSAFLCRSFIFERAGKDHNLLYDPTPRVDHQKSAQLHCLYGVPILQAKPGSPWTRANEMRLYACAKVYDLRQYTEKTKWGPFMDDDTDRVDWEKVEAIMIVIGSNLRKLRLTSFPECKDHWELSFAGVWPQSYVPSPFACQPESLELQDPYDITGNWLRVVCFLDYTDFFAYNFSTQNVINPSQPLPAIDFGEATRLILMKLHVTKIEPPGPDDGQELPVVYFEGVSRSLDDSRDENANSDLRGMRGSVRLTREGEVRWTTFSIFSGEERWRSESVQIGGVRSAKGVLGNWFDKDFDHRGPAGPTAFWKVPEGITNSQVQSALSYDFNNESEDEYEPLESPQSGDEDGEEEMVGWHFTTRVAQDD
ncbi:uncharacterized protein F4822DRAFT_30698 [Hypoxylon trugodes]|uniref:uncharacterized protein n=1 Tax=Hypoxylon trugodes TaxID=326681 RepID=UPI00219F1AF7|nr:uncharacterized protein F4822DRAFT_30698 [Hypoxylon trugodes]KAI1393941.1 hypothetical protein F4822DRAFT_30698 [Hypoxylon trugodes]